MRLRWLLLAVVTMSLSPTIASARSQILPLEATAPNYSLTAAFELGVHAGTLVLAFHNPDPSRSITLPIRVVAETIQYDWLTVEISNATTSRTLRLVADRESSAVQTVRIEPKESHFERIDLDPWTQDLPPGEYVVRVTWDGQITTTATTTMMAVPYHCGLSRVAPPVLASPASKLPYVLGGFAIMSLLVGFRLAKRAGTADGRVPCSAL